MEPDAPSPVEIIDNRYRDATLISKRGLAVAYSAIDSSSGDRVFLKILRESKLNDAQSYQLFCREPSLLRTFAAEAAHIPIPRLQSEGTWKERPYFTQPFLNGWSLDKPIRKHLRFNAAAVLQIIEGCLRFLSTLHDTGYVHGDLSPDNIFIQTGEDFSTNGEMPKDFTLVLLDYNSSRRIDEPVRQPGERGVVFLKLPYAAPEIALGYPMSVQSDLYALGVVFFELLVGTRPYHDPKSMQAVRDLRYVQIPTFPAELQVPRTIEDIVRKLLQPDSKLCFASAADCLIALQEATYIHQWLSKTSDAQIRRYHLPDSKDYFVPGSLTHSVPAPVWSELLPVTEPASLPKQESEEAGLPDLLVIKELTGQMRRWELKRNGTLTIGRAPAREIRLDDVYVSRKTATIVRNDASPAYLEVHTEVNRPSITVNGELVGNEVGARKLLNNNDSFQILEHRFEVLYGYPTYESAGMIATGAEVVSVEVSMAYSVPIPGDDSEGKGGIDLVDFSVFAPATVSPESSFILEIWAYLPADRKEVMERAGRHGRLIERGSRGPVYVQGRSELTLVVRLDDFQLQDTQDTIIWSGDITNVAFIVRTPKGLGHGVYPGQISILHNGLLLTRLIFELAVGKRTDDQGNLNFRRQQFKSAFASYASADRDEVLRRVQGIRATGMDVFVDVLSLRTGQAWEDELFNHIRTRDIFYLFWSNAARASEWVSREWHYALKEKGLDFIHPIPLAPPDQVPPPEELRSKHFNDITLAVIKSRTVASMVE